MYMDLQHGVSKGFANIIYINSPLFNSQSHYTFFPWSYLPICYFIVLQVLEAESICKTVYEEIPLWMVVNGKKRVGAEAWFHH